MPQKVQSELQFFGKSSIEPVYYGQRLVEKVILLVNLESKSLILDAGCGEGYWGRVFASRGHQVVGIDLSPEVISNAQKKSIPGQSFLVGNLLEKLPFSNKYFDLVFCGGILHHFPDKEDIQTAVQNLFSCLKKDGKIVLVEPNGSNPVVYLSRQIGRFLVHYYSKDIASENETVHSARTYLNILEKSGFEIQKIESCIQKRQENKKIQNFLDFIFYSRYFLLKLFWKFLPQPYKGGVIIIAGKKVID